MGSDGKLYQHTGAALLRAAAMPLTGLPTWWPDPSDTEVCGRWLRQVWADARFADAVRQASGDLASRVDAICAGQPTRSKQVRRAAIATVRYLLRATGRPTPFGLFAGVTAASVGSTPHVRWGDAHQAVARVDTEWLDDVIVRLEACPILLERLDVVLNNLAARRGGRLHVPHGGPMGATVRRTSAVRVIERLAGGPVRFAALAEQLAAAFPRTEPQNIRTLLGALVREKFLITSLRAPMTDTDPLSHLIERLHGAVADAGMVPQVAQVLHELEAVQRAVHEHNRRPASAQGLAWEELTGRLRRLSDAGRNPLAVDLRLDAEVRIPESVAQEMERAADALLRLTRRPTGQGVWKEYQVAFWERYGTGTLVPVKEVVDPASGLGYPAEYPGSRMTAPPPTVSERDERLLALAWQALADGSREIVVTDDLIDRLAGDAPAGQEAPPHVEMCARLHADSLPALEDGDFTLTVTPARAAGTLTSRFTPAATGTGLGEVYRQVPTGVENALTAQLSFPPLYPHTENVARIPAYLPHVISLGEHRSPDDTAPTVIDVDDLAVTATHTRLYLVSISRRRLVDPQVFHAMALDKQPPPLARFLAHLTRSFGPAWTSFDWGPHGARLPFLPRVRYGRVILSPIRWNLTAEDLPSRGAGMREWTDALGRWRKRWHCHGAVELREDDRTRRLQLDVPAHATVLRAHLDREGHAVLTEAPAEETYGWIGGHVHEIALPMTSTRRPIPDPLSGFLPLLTNSTLGPVPGAVQAPWLNAKIYSHPDQLDELIGTHLARLAPQLPGTPEWWFIRYRTPHDLDHLRLRIRTRSPGQYAACTELVAGWATGLRREGLSSRLVFDTYTPEIGRYGPAASLRCAEAVFTADSAYALAALQGPGVDGVDGRALATVGMVDIACGLLGPDEGMRWLANRPAPPARVERGVSDQAIQLVRHTTPRARSWGEELAQAWHRRAVALALYREHLAESMDLDSVLESLLHMHHNRLRGADREDERICRRLARQSAVAWAAWPGESR
ncbi:lantibiotic dehydratase [Streptomyces sp. ME08-AFT2]|uniref:lantibiotic dehydratase n=1 Tax=Streptomyces sp. ME08-AFT2 TaxID=3028683 RepID=UPI0029B97343|nr:lantibiotic dehydratase [Streptomyces sp. ME08-AFT2]MDX3308886.1 lantibiotic dehydratase [Streptomyces sp. ME08-AFT2]